MRLIFFAFLFSLSVFSSQAQEVRLSSSLDLTQEVISDGPILECARQNALPVVVWIDGRAEIECRIALGHCCFYRDIFESPERQYCVFFEGNEYRFSKIELVSETETVSYYKGY